MSPKLYKNLAPSENKNFFMFRFILLSALLFKNLSRMAWAEYLPDRDYDAIHGLWCPILKNLICGSDGVNYWNECIFLANKAGKGIDILKEGYCEELDCDECENSNDKESAQATGIEICGSNGQVFQNRCLFECHADIYPMLTQVYETCRPGFASRSELENATSDVYKEVFDAYGKKLVEVIQNHKYNTMLIKRMAFKAELNEQNVNIICYKTTVSDLSSLTKFDNIYFYSYNDVSGRTKFVFKLTKLQFSVKKFTVAGLGVKLTGKMDITVKSNTFEIVADVSTNPGANYCPLIHAISLRLVDIDEITIDAKPPLPPHIVQLPIEGFIKEKIIAVMNEEIAPVIVEKMAEIACIESGRCDEEKTCFFFFQGKMCF